MSASGLLGALLEYVGDVLVNDCGRPVPDRVLRYHGMIPNDCCTEAGFLAASWSQEFVTVNFPAQATGTADVCSGWPVLDVQLRYVVCWPEPDVDENGVTLRDAEWDEAAAMLLDVADCVSRSLRVLSCDALTGDPYTDAVLAQVGRSEGLRLMSAEPIRAQGGCAGVQWRLLCSVRAGQAAS